MNSKIRFDIGMKKKWKAETNISLKKPIRSAIVYVFCVFALKNRVMQIHLIWVSVFSGGINDYLFQVVPKEVPLEPMSERKKNPRKVGSERSESPTIGFFQASE